MRRRTFVSSVVAFVCLPFPMLRKKCPYRIEVMRSTQDRIIGYRFYDEKQLVGWHSHRFNTFSFCTPIEGCPFQIEEKINQIIPGNYKMHFWNVGKFDWINTKNQLVASFYPTTYFDSMSQRMIKARILYLKIRQDFSPEQAAWKMYEIRQVLEKTTNKPPVVYYPQMYA